MVNENLPLARQFDPKSTLEVICSIIRKAVSSTDVEIKAIAVTSMRQAVVFLDHNDSELYIGSNIDLRAIFEGAEIDSKYQHDIYRITGHLPSFLFATAKLEWMKRNSPNLYSNIAKVITLGDWIMWRLTGEINSEFTLAGEAGLLNVSTKQWATELSKMLDVPISDTIPLLSIGERSGLVTKKASDKTNLPCGIPVTSGGADTQCGSLGVGAISQNDVSIISGWSCPIQWVTSTPFYIEDASSWFGCHAVNKYWTSELTAGDTGHSYSWLANTLRQNFTNLDLLASRTPPGAEGTSMIFTQQTINMSKIGITTGAILLPAPITMNERGDGHLARAALESTAYTVKARLAQLEQNIGIEPKNVYLGGGMAKSKTFAKILVNVLDREISIASTTNANATGGFIAAMTTINEYGSLAEGASQAKLLLDTNIPNAIEALQYQEFYEIWKIKSANLASINN